MSRESVKLWNLCQLFIAKHRISEPAVICQVDSVIIDAYHFIEEICNIVGYLPVEELE